MDKGQIDPMPFPAVLCMLEGHIIRGHIFHPKNISSKIQRLTFQSTSHPPWYISDQWRRSITYHPELFCIPAAKNNGSSRVPPHLHQKSISSSNLKQCSSPTVGVNSSICPCISVIAEDHIAVRLFQPPYDSKDVMDCDLFFLPLEDRWKIIESRKVRGN